MINGAHSPNRSMRATQPPSLPGSLDELRGLRAARWIRESTAGQYDRYGPGSQHEQMDRFAERYGLVDSGIVYTPLLRAAEPCGARRRWRTCSRPLAPDPLMSF